MTENAPAAPALPDELSIYTAADTCAAWRVWLAGLDPARGAPALDARTVDIVDGAGIQLLLALARSLRARGTQLRLHAPSVALQRACEALGVGALLTSTEAAA